MKICGACKMGKTEDSFRLCKYKNGTLYYHSICSICTRQKALEYAKNHRDDRKKYQKDYSATNPEYKKEWKSINKDKIRRQERERHATDINFKLKKNVSRSIRHAITKQGLSTFKHLPYTVQELKKHLESQFDTKMSWDNYGSYWHIDHIIPHSLFKYVSMEDDAFNICWALSNLRPLEAHQNMMDGSTRIRHKNNYYANNNTYQQELNMMRITHG
jgi:hypothetical protein